MQKQTRAERDVQASIMLHIGQRPFLRIWRQNVGVAVPLGQVAKVQRLLDRGQIAMAQSAMRQVRVVSFGQKGSADLTGALACGKRLELEVKAPGGKQSEDQRIFQRVCDGLGVLYAVVDSEESVDAVLAKHVQGCSVCRMRNANA